MDEAGSRARIQATMRPPDVKSVEVEIEEIKGRKEAAIKAQDFEKAAALRDSEKEAKDKLENILTEWRTRRDEQEVVVTEDDIRHVVSKWTGVPLSRMEQADMDRLLRVSEELKGKVIGQDEAVYAMGKALRRSRADLKDPKRPIGSFIFLGPTGVGKTHLAKTLAQYMFGDETALIQIDMSEYMDATTSPAWLERLPATSVTRGRQLSEKVRRRPYSVVLFDEIEKAHPDIWNLPPADPRGRRGDGQPWPQGRFPQHHHHHDLQRRRRRGEEKHGHGLRHQDRRGRLRADEGQDAQRSQARLQARVPEPARRHHRLPFAHARRPHQDRRHRSGEGAQAPQAREVTFRLTPEATAFLIEKGYDPAYGARPLRRAVERYLEDPMAEEILRGTIKNGDFVIVGEKDKALTFTVGVDTPPHPSPRAVKPVM